MAFRMLNIEAGPKNPRLLVQASPNLMTFNLSHLPHSGQQKVTITRDEAEAFADLLDQWLADGEN